MTDDLNVTSKPDICAVILAAGRGTRMGALTDTVPKPLLPVLGRPALYWVIDGLANAGITRFIIVTGYKSEMVREALTDYGKGRLDIAFEHQDQQNGTAHAMRLTRSKAGNSAVLLAFADIMTSPGNFGRIVSRFKADQCDLTAAVRDAGDPYRAAAVYVNSQCNIIEIIEKPPLGTSTTPWSHAGIYCFSNAIYDYIEKVKPSIRGEYEITDAVQMMLKDGLRSKAVELSGYWKDLATPEDIVEAEAVMATPRSVNLLAHQRAVNDANLT